MLLTINFIHLLLLPILINCWMKLDLSMKSSKLHFPVSWGCRIRRQQPLQRGKTTPACPGYDTKQSDGVVPVMLGPWGMQSTPSLPLLPGPIWHGTVAPDRALSIG